LNNQSTFPRASAFISDRRRPSRLWGAHLRVDRRVAGRRIQILIVDDEAGARARVKDMLADEADMEIAGECANGPDAIAFIQKHRPDLVLMEVELPRLSAFDVLRALAPADRPVVIFVTNHDQYALEAFAFDVADYLLKTFAEPRFRQALERARQHLERSETSRSDHCFQELPAAQGQSANFPSRLAVRSGKRIAFVPVDDVDCIEAASNYVILHVGTMDHILRGTLTDLQARLSPRRFLRVNRSTIVNLERVTGVQPAKGSGYVVVLQNGQELSLSLGVQDVQKRLEFL
jgi:two-component system LytT family response regulator